MALRKRMSTACPTLKELDAKILALTTLVNEEKTDHNAFVTAITTKLNAVNAIVTELRTDHNAHVAAITAKLNLVIANCEDVRAKFTLHRAVVAHADNEATTALAGDVVAAIATDANLITAAAEAAISTTANMVAAATVVYE